MNVFVIYYFLARICDACRYFLLCFTLGVLERTLASFEPKPQCKVQVLTMLIEGLPLSQIQLTTRRIPRVFPAINVLEFD